VIFESILNRPPTAAVRLNPEVGPELERIIEKALEKDRDTRYQHAADMLADLKRVKRDTESARIIAQLEPSTKPAKSGRLWLMAGAIVLLALAGAGILYVRSTRSAQIDSIAVLPFTNAAGDANAEYLSDGITESLINNLTHVPTLKVKSAIGFSVQGKGG
jgi:hypothetical protein